MIIEEIKDKLDKLEELLELKRRQKNYNKILNEIVMGTDHYEYLRKELYRVNDRVEELEKKIK